MRQPVFTSQYRKDIAKIAKRGWDFAALKELVRKLLSGEKLDSHYNDHPLRGKWAGRRDAHIEPNWLLIYKVTEQHIIFERTGSHSDIF